MGTKRERELTYFGEAYRAARSGKKVVVVHATGLSAKKAGLDFIRFFDLPRHVGIVECSSGRVRFNTGGTVTFESVTYARYGRSAPPDMEIIDDSVEEKGLRDKVRELDRAAEAARVEAAAARDKLSAFLKGLHW